jgi:GTPase SAR1 family protein
MCLQVNEQYIRPVLLVGLKSDLERSVQYIDGERAALALDVAYVECSARFNQNVEAVFDMVLLEIFKLE